MKRQIQGRYVEISTVSKKSKAFIPNPLPPVPALSWSKDLLDKFDYAMLVLGKLDNISTFVPNVSIFVYMYVRKEAVLSSLIEGTQSSLSDLMLFEINEKPSVPIGDVKEVSNYVAALEHGINRLKNGFPLSLRLIKEIHKILLGEGRGSNQDPGYFRKNQNWIGGITASEAVYVPPPPEHILKCMNDLELFLHDNPEPTSILVKSALAHVQFETIHPFLDGNGRIGRLLIILLLYNCGILKKPLLYLSLYFKIHRQSYYRLLNNVRLEGDWEEWLNFFADAVISTANQAIKTTQSVIELIKESEFKIHKLGRASISALQIHNALLKRPITTSSWLVEETNITPTTINKSLKHLCELNIIKEISDKKRNKIYNYFKYIEILNVGTDFC